MVANSLVAQIEALVTPLLAQEQVDIVDIEYQREPTGWTLRFYLDKPGGFTLQDCAGWSHRLGEVLDTSNVLTSSYNLEISSPGINRALRKTSDFQKFYGERVHVKLYAPIQGQKNFHGVLLQADEESIRIKAEKEEEVELKRDQIAKARLDPVIDF